MRETKTKITAEELKALEAVVEKPGVTRDVLREIARGLCDREGYGVHALRTKIEAKLSGLGTELHHVLADAGSAILGASAGDEGALERAHELLRELEKRAKMARLSVELAQGRHAESREAEAQDELFEALEQFGPGTAACFDRRRMTPMLEADKVSR